MKKPLLIFIALTFSALSSCKHDAVNPAPPITPDINVKISTDPSSPVIVPLLVAGKKNASGLVNGTRSAARFNDPLGICVGPDGSLYVSDYGNEAVRKISTQNNVTTLNINPDLFGDPYLFEGPNSLAVLNDGTVGIVSNSYIIIYKNGHVTNQLNQNLVTSGQFGGICKDPGGTFFYYSVTDVNLPANIINSFYGSIKNNNFYGSQIFLLAQKYTDIIDACANGYKYIVYTDTNTQGLYKVPSTGAPVRIYANLHFNNIFDIAVNRSGSEIYIVDLGNIKRIKNNVLTTIISGVNAQRIALANSEHFLYYTSSDNTVNRIPLP